MAALARPDLLSELSATLDESSVTGLLADVVLGPPVPRPQKSFGVGLNYRGPRRRGRNGGARQPARVHQVPVVHRRPDRRRRDPQRRMRLRRRTRRRDRQGRQATSAIADAWDHVVGVTVGQDISDRPAQFAAKPPHFDLGKSFDTFGPIGPVLVSIDEIADRDNLHIVCARQRRGPPGRQHRRPDLRRPDARQLSCRASPRSCTGDIIFTGTPEGVGAAQGKFLADGDVITTTIDGIGTMTNRVVASATLPLGG